MISQHGFNRYFNVVFMHCFHSNRLACCYFWLGARGPKQPIDSELLIQCIKVCTLIGRDQSWFAQAMCVVPPMMTQHSSRILTFTPLTLLLIRCFREIWTIRVRNITHGACTLSDMAVQYHQVSKTLSEGPSQEGHQNRF